MEKEKILSLLKDHNKEQAEMFSAYCIRLLLDKKRDGSLQNPWMQKKTSDQMAILFKRVAKDGLVFDGVHITLQSTGISYDYVAYKNKMLLAYPESKIDVGLVYEGDTFSVAKESGSVVYSHTISDPFNHGNDKLKGGYCVIQNKRGEFLTTLSRAEIDKHRKVAKTDFIWQQWFSEMALKTLIKKACKQHFADVYENIEEIDNDNYDLDNPLDIDLKIKQEIELIESIEELKVYYTKNKGRGKDFDKAISLKKEALKK